MPEPLSPGTVRRMEELCASVRVSTEQDPQIRQELMGHMEDKLRAYLAGDEKPTEEDALLLVERHFGNLDQLQRDLREVHTTFDAWLRRLAAIVIVSIVGRLPWMILFVVRQHVSINMEALDINNMNSDSFHAVGLSLLVAWALLFRWNRLSEAGQVPWFQRWRRRTLICLTLAAVLPLLAPFLLVFAPGFFNGGVLHLLDLAMRGPGFSEEGLARPFQWLVRLRLSSYAFGTAELLCTAEAVIWLWWLSRGTSSMSAHLKRIAWAAVAWTVFGNVLGGPVPAEPFTPVITYAIFGWALLPVGWRARASLAS